ncbi:MAG: hypothetical protein FJ086_12235 [Deltaproteobacteria bacterium]|nr:hypothetical protein [Deltaproteobacteria bacterium]
MTKRLLLVSLAAALFGSGCIIIGSGAQRGDILLDWTFAGQTCSAAGVANVRLSIPGETLENGGLFPCASTVFPVTLQDFRSGSYPYTIEGLASNGFVLFRKAGTFAVKGDVSYQLTLDWAVGGADVGWTLSASGVNVSCDQAGVSTVYVNFRGANGAWVYGEAGDPQQCNVTSVSYDYLAPGTYAVYVAGRDSMARLYEPFDTVNLPLVTVTAGKFTPQPISLSLVLK